MAQRGRFDGSSKAYSDSFYQRLRVPFFTWLPFLLIVALMLIISIVPLNFEQQALFGVAALILSLVVRSDDDDSRLRALMLVFISCIATGRYIYWRVTESVAWSDEGLSFFDLFFSFGLLAAECYAWITLFLGYFQTVWPLKRAAIPLPEDMNQWPSVDVFIPTFNEPLKVVTSTILAAKSIDWPADRLNVYLLDDGGREEFRRFAAEAGVHYIARTDNTHAKAGNINHALGLTKGEYIAIFDSDHVPTRPFLRKVMGWFLRDNKLGLLQTPHLFCSPDPVERNLDVFRRVPNEGQLFYGLIQDGNDTWNAAFFCGSCAVLRRAALEEIGGIATDTVTEDAHTSLLLHRRGWQSAYINEPMAAGLATERLAAHVGQRTRWACGMIQIFRLDNPLFGRGLSLAQRLTYFNAMFHFFFSLPRIIFLTAPLAYLLFELHIIQTTAAMIVVYALPHIIQAHVTNSALQRRYRHNFWSEVYETLISAHLFWPTLAAFFSPGKPKFNVTDKGGVIEDEHFDWYTAKPIFFMLLLSMVGLIVGIGRLFWWNTHETDTVLINLAWNGYSLIILGAAMAVAWEKKQRRSGIRVPRRDKAMLTLRDGQSVDGFTQDLSLSDVCLQLARAPQLVAGEPVSVSLFDGQNYHTFSGTAGSLQGKRVGIKFDELDAPAMANLVYLSHMRDGAWEEWYGACKPRRTLGSFLEVLRYGLVGLTRSLFSYASSSPQQRSVSFSALGWLAVILLLAVGNHFYSRTAQAETLDETHAAGATQHLETQSASVKHLSFGQLGVDKALRLQRTNDQQTVYFSVRSDERPVEAHVALSYSLPPTLAKDFSHLNVSVNGQVVGELEIDPQATGAEKRRTLPIDPILIGEHNRLTIELAGKDPAACKILDAEQAGAIISPNSELMLLTQPLALANDLSFFPIPFYDPKDPSKLALPFVLDSDAVKSMPYLESAATLASWFGAKADYRGVAFPVHLDDIPASHAVIFLTADDRSPLADISGITGPGVQIATHPKNPYAKLLLVMGRNEQELRAAVASLVSGRMKAEGGYARIADTKSPPRSLAYDSPRWVPVDHKVSLSDMVDAKELRVNSLPSDVIKLNFRVPPDLFAGEDKHALLTLNYYYPSQVLEKGSALNVSLNGKHLRHLSLWRPAGATSLWEKIKMTLTGGDKAGPSETLYKKSRIKLPLNQLAEFNELQLHFDLRPEDMEQAPCVFTSTTLRAGIEGDSTLNFAGFHHYALMPDLAKFANSGFPFSRYADLSETALVLPNDPTSADFRTVLEVLGKIGAATGVPATGIELLRSEKIDLAKDKDILLIGGIKNQPLLSVWADQLPLSYSSSAKRWELRKSTWRDSARAWLQDFPGRQTLAAVEKAHAAAENAFASLVGFRSPLNSRRSVVAFIADDSEALPSITAALQDARKLRGIQGDVVLFSGEEVSGARATSGFYAGEAPFWTRFLWYLSHHFVLFLLLFIGLVIAGAMLLRALLRHRAALRFVFKQGGLSDRYLGEFK
jgi:cellulose synthase (UDP-forming)